MAAKMRLVSHSFHHVDWTRVLIWLGLAVFVMVADWEAYGLLTALVRVIREW
jgi:hypothetical protein